MKPLFKALFALALLIPSISFAQEDSFRLLERRSEWRSTGANNDLVRNESLFSFAGRAGNKILRTDNTETNIHSHYVGNRSSSIKNYMYTGRMRLLDANGGVGVTFYSKYLNSDTYYRLRRYAGEPTFHIAPHGTEITSGTVDTGVNPVAGVWYNFKILVRTTRAGTRIRAKVWAKGTREPRGYPVDATDASVTRIRTGRPGVWAMADGRKEWVNLAVQLVD